MMCVRYIIVHGGPCHLQTFSTRAAPRLAALRHAAAPSIAAPLCLAAFHVATPKRPLTLSSSASKRIFNAQDMTFIHSSLKINKGPLNTKLTVMNCIISDADYLVSSFSGLGYGGWPKLLH